MRYKIADCVQNNESYYKRTIGFKFNDGDDDSRILDDDYENGYPMPALQIEDEDQDGKFIREGNSRRTQYWAN